MHSSFFGKLADSSTNGASVSFAIPRGNSHAHCCVATRQWRANRKTELPCSSGCSTMQTAPGLPFFTDATWNRRCSPVSRTIAVLFITEKSAPPCSWNTSRSDSMTRGGRASSTGTTGCRTCWLCSCAASICQSPIKLRSALFCAASSVAIVHSNKHSSNVSARPEMVIEGPSLYDLSSNAFTVLGPKAKKNTPSHTSTSVNMICWQYRYAVRSIPAKYVANCVCSFSRFSQMRRSWSLCQRFSNTVDCANGEFCSSWNASASNFRHARFCSVESKLVTMMARGRSVGSLWMTAGCCAHNH